MECIINEEKHRKLTKENLVSRIKAEDWLYILMISIQKDFI